ncbi:MAG: uncharacterized protein A8A55_0318 [Amphiamblys sp. WSBS2006]|nr:MAG: uncharacterized protein A8A55_0318 [Amphiamblys sp. WSBS2006]
MLFLLLLACLFSAKIERCTTLPAVFLKIVTETKKETKTVTMTDMFFELVETTKTHEVARPHLKVLYTDTTNTTKREYTVTHTAKYEFTVTEIRPFMLTVYSEVCIAEYGSTLTSNTTVTLVTPIHVYSTSTVPYTGFTFTTTTTIVTV